MNWLTGWILRGETLVKVPMPLTISSTFLRSLRMTSGLFNTGSAGDSAEITSSNMTVQPATLISKLEDNGFLADTLDPIFDMNMIGGFEPGLIDPLGDASMDSFTDLTSFLTEGTFLDQEGIVVDAAVGIKIQKNPLKRSLVAQNDHSPALGISTSVGLVKSSNHDHDYSSKRPEMSPLTGDSSAENLEDASHIPIPSPSTSTADEPAEDKYWHRRVKNNIASKRSREIRKKKFVNMEAEAERLIIENAKLEKRVVELEQLAKQMREILVARMAGK